MRIAIGMNAQFAEISKISQLTHLHRHMTKAVTGVNALYVTRQMEIRQFTPTPRTSTFVTLAEESFPTTRAVQPHVLRRQPAPSVARSTAILRNTASVNGKPMPKASAQKYVPPAARWQTSCMVTLIMTAR